MLTDYKFHQIRRDGNSTSALVLFYEGEMGEMETLPDENGKTEIIPVYVRTNVIAKKNLVFAGDVETEKICELLNSELAKDSERVPIEMQVVTKEPTVEPIHVVDKETDRRVLKRVLK